MARVQSRSVKCCQQGRRDDGVIKVERGLAQGIKCFHVFGWCESNSKAFERNGLEIQAVAARDIE
jgi:hypothetical protein